MRTLFILLPLVMLAACSASSPSEQTAPTITARWKWLPKSPIGSPEGIIIARSGEKVEATWVDLKSNEGFVVDSQKSRGKYDPQKNEIVFPPGPLTSEEVDVLVEMNGPRLVVPFTPDADILKLRWVGQGAPQIEHEFVRVKE